MPIWVSEIPPFYLAYVAGVFREAGWDCTIKDLNIDLYHHARKDRDTISPTFWRLALWTYDLPEQIYATYKATIERLLSDALTSSAHVDMIAFSVNCSNRFFTLKAVEYLRTVCSVEQPILFGGPDCFPNEYHRRFFAEAGRPDFICQGEAEIALPAFLSRLPHEGATSTDVPGFLFVSDDTVLNTGLPELPTKEALNISPDWSQFDYNKYNSPGITTYLSRACIARCVFCSERVNFRRYRLRDPKYVVDQIARDLRQLPYSDGPPYVHMADSLINGDIAALNTFLQCISTRKLRFNWAGMARLRPEMTIDLLTRMSDAGCVEISWGLESGSQHVLDLMRKRCDLHVAAEILRIASEIGITNRCMLIVGYPGETVSDYLETIRFVLAFQDRVAFNSPNIALATANSLLATQYERWGLRDAHITDWVSADGRNTPAVRSFRAFVLNSLIVHPSLSLGAVPTESLASIDLNEPAVASDIVGQLIELGHLCNVSARLATVLDTWDNSSPSASASICSPEAIAASTSHISRQNVSLQCWFTADKNAYKQRQRICALLFSLIVSLRGRSSEYLASTTLASTVKTAAG